MVPRRGGGENVGVASELEELDGVLPGGGAGAVDEDWGGRIGRRGRGREGGVRECEVGCAEERPEGGDVVVWDGCCLFEWVGRWELRRCRVSKEAKGEVSEQTHFSNDVLADESILLQRFVLRRWIIE